jgi:hypothetical protein
VTVQIVDIDEAIAGPGQVVVLIGLLLGVRNVKSSAEILDVERGEPSRDPPVPEASLERDLSEAGVEDVDGAEPEVGREQVVVADGEPLVDGAFANA